MLMRLFSSYGVAAISVGIAGVMTLKLGAVVKHSATLFFCSVMLSSWYGGLWPGLFAALLAFVALDYYFMPPLYTFGIGLEELPDTIAFVAAAFFISWLNGNQKHAKESLRRARDELDAMVRERTADLKRVNEQLRSEIVEREAAQDGLTKAQAQIARIARITTMGELAASIAHELNLPQGRSDPDLDRMPFGRLCAVADP
jgi:K+-sensing histidine kinase KdpD